MNNCKHMILQQLPAVYRRLLEPVSFLELEEIRFRIDRPVLLYGRGGYTFLSASGGITDSPSAACTPSRTDMDALAAALCTSSVYAFLNDIKEGFLTLRGGHRVGIAGKCVTKDGAVTNITSVSGINIRIAKAYPGCAAELSAQLRTDKYVKNTLLISPPQCGKTTFLRDLTRILSAEFKITVVDERSEIAGSYEGRPQFDLGLQADVLDRFPKASGILLALRSLSPQIIVTDELGTEADCEALQSASCSGCRLIASIHGDSVRGIAHTKGRLLSFFDTAVILGRRNNRPAVLQIQNLE